MKTQKSFYVQNGGTYIRVGDVLLPDLTLDRAESKPIGKYGRIRKQYLKEQLPGIYFAMLLNGELCRHLSSIDEAANERIELIMTQLAHKRGISVKLKGEDQLRWMTYVFGRYHTTNPYYAFTYMPIQNYL